MLGYNPEVAVAVDSQELHLNQWSFLGSRNGPLSAMPLLIEWLTSGRIIPVIDAVYSLKEANEALKRIAAGDVTGRLVVKL